MITLEFVDQEDLERAMAARTRAAVKDALERQERNYRLMLAAVVKAAGGKVTIPIGVMQNLPSYELTRTDLPEGAVEFSVDKRSPRT